MATYLQAVTESDARLELGCRQDMLKGAWQCSASLADKTHAQKTSLMNSHDVATKARANFLPVSTVPELPATSLPYNLPPLSAKWLPTFPTPKPVTGGLQT